MDLEQRIFLTLTVLPACLTQQQTAWFLGLQLFGITAMVKARVIKPLGKPSDNSVKLFALVELERLKANPERLSQAVDAAQNRWRRKNRNWKERRRAAQNGKSRGHANRKHHSNGLGELAGNGQTE